MELEVPIYLKRERVSRKRNPYLMKQAGALRNRGMDEVQILAILRLVNAEDCVPPLADAEVQGIARRAGRFGARPAAHGGVAAERRAPAALAGSSGPAAGARPELAEAGGPGGAA